MTTSTIRIPTPLRTLTDGAASVEVTADDVRGALTHLGEHHAELVARVLDDEGELRPFVNLFVGSRDVRDLEGLSTPVQAGDVLTILPAVAGGRLG